MPYGYYDATKKYTVEYLRENTELKEMIEDAHQTLLDLRAQAELRSPDKPHLFGKVKKDIARIKTIMREQKDGKKIT